MTHADALALIDAVQGLEVVSYLYFVGWVILTIFNRL